MVNTAVWNDPQTIPEPWRIMAQSFVIASGENRGEDRAKDWVRLRLERVCPAPLRDVDRLGLRTRFLGGDLRRSASVSDVDVCGE